MAYSDAFSNSFKASTFSTKSISGIDYKSFGNTNVDNINFNALKKVTANIGGFAKAAEDSGSGWTFITAPEDVAWETSNTINRVEMFGTNNPPVVIGTRGMRDLSVNNALVEGFSRNMEVEGKIAALEKLMDYKLNGNSGFVSAPVFQLWAANKSYGGSDAFYVISSVAVKEVMRDLQGKATRAYVDIKLMQVPKYQVNTGRDQASQPLAGSKSQLSQAATQAATQSTTQSASDVRAAQSANQGVSSANSSGSGGPSPQKVPSTRPTTTVSVGGR